MHTARFGTLIISSLTESFSAEILLDGNFSPLLARFRQVFDSLVDH
jgi:hypothetical protein